MLLLLGQLPQPGGHRLRLLLLAELDQRLDEIGRNRKRARLLHALALHVLSQTRRRLSAARLGLVGEQCCDPARPQRFEHAASRTGRLGARERGRCPPLRLVGERRGPPPAAHGNARTSAQIRSPSSADSAHSSSSRDAASHSPGAQLEVAQVQPLRARTRPPRRARRRARAGASEAPAPRARAPARRAGEPRPARAIPRCTRPRPMRRRNARTGRRSGCPRRTRAQPRACRTSRSTSGPAPARARQAPPAPTPPRRGSARRSMRSR